MEGGLSINYPRKDGKTVALGFVDKKFLGDCGN